MSSDASVSPLCICKFLSAHIKCCSVQVISKVEMQRGLDAKELISCQETYVHVLVSSTSGGS